MAMQKMTENDNTIINKKVALFCFSLYCLCMYSSLNWAAEPKDFAPKLTVYTGRLSFLTYHSNVLNFLYWCLIVIVCFVLSKTNKYKSILERWIVKLFPLMFTLASFISLGYYALDHFNPINMSKKNALSRGKYPMIWASSHCEHAHGIIAAILMALFMKRLPYSNEPTVNDCLYQVPSYIFFYLIEVHWIYYNTGEWVYPVLKDVTLQGGALARILLMITLAGINVLFGLIGLAIFNSRQADSLGSSTEYQDGTPVRRSRRLKTN